MVVQPKIRKRLKKIIAKDKKTVGGIKNQPMVTSAIKKLEETQQKADASKTRVEKEIQAIEVAKDIGKKAKPAVFIPNAMVVDEKTKQRIFAYVPPEDIPFDSFEKKYTGFHRKYNGLYLHQLRLDRECNYTQLPRMKAEEGRSPIDLYTNKHCADEVEETYGLSMPTTEKIKWGIFITLIIAIIVTVFLIALS